MTDIGIQKINEPWPLMILKGREVHELLMITQCGK